MLQQRLGRHDEAGRADAALERGVFEERLLNGVQLAALGHALDGVDLLALGFDAENEAGGYDSTVELDGAGAAVAVVATLFGAGQADHVAQHFQQALAGLAQEVRVLAVDYRLYIGLSGQSSSPSLARWRS